MGGTYRFELADQDSWHLLSLSYLFNIVNNRLCCSWASFLVNELDFQGNEPKPKQVQVH